MACCFRKVAELARIDGCDAAMACAKFVCRFTSDNTTAVVVASSQSPKLDDVFHFSDSLLTRNPADQSPTDRIKEILTTFKLFGIGNCPEEEFMIRYRLAVFPRIKKRLYEFFEERMMRASIAGYFSRAQDWFGAAKSSRVSLVRLFHLMTVLGTFHPRKLMDIAGLDQFSSNEEVLNALSRLRPCKSRFPSMMSKSEGSSWILGCFDVSIELPFHAAWKALGIEVPQELDFRLKVDDCASGLALRAARSIAEAHGVDLPPIQDSNPSRDVDLDLSKAVHSTVKLTETDPSVYVQLMLISSCGFKCAQESLSMICSVR